MQVLLLQQVLVELLQLSFFSHQSSISSNVQIVFHKPFQDARRLIETVNGQLTEQFHIELNHSHTFSGICARLATKLTAHTLSVYLNRLLGNPNPFTSRRWLFLSSITAESSALMKVSRIYGYF